MMSWLLWKQDCPSNKVKILPVTTSVVTGIFYAFTNKIS